MLSLWFQDNMYLFILIRASLYQVIKKATENDADMMDINLNNIKFISPAKWEELFK